MQQMNRAVYTGKQVKSKMKIRRKLFQAMKMAPTRLRKERAQKLLAIWLNPDLK
ncbi:hypothetical protein J4732_16125 [Serratia marcescens]|uniref:Uncharacterized protein n=1 Tax=Serratia marcescens TaxID=615 RepID=A0A939NRS0_SERMA|nr:hypothetical protein [Serratia marcescens]